MVICCCFVKFHLAQASLNSIYYVAEDDLELPILLPPPLGAGFTGLYHHARL